MKQTSNFSLNKPELTDSPDITVLNPNFDKIDENLKSLTDKDTELNTEINQVKNGYLPLSGGTMTGNLKGSSKSWSIQKTTTDGNLTLRGGTSIDNCATLVLGGKDDSTYLGQFFIRATSDSANSSLAGYPDGKLTWGGKHVVRSINGTFADASGNVTLEVGGGGEVGRASASVSVSISTSGYTVASTGMLFLYAVGQKSCNKSSIAVYSGSTKIGEFDGYHSYTDSSETKYYTYFCPIFVNKGEKIYVKSGSSAISFSARLVPTAVI